MQIPNGYNNVQFSEAGLKYMGVDTTSLQQKTFLKSLVVQGLPLTDHKITALHSLEAPQVKHKILKWHKTLYESQDYRANQKFDTGNKYIQETQINAIPCVKQLRGRNSQLKRFLSSHCSHNGKRILWRWWWETGVMYLWRHFETFSNCTWL